MDLRASDLEKLTKEQIEEFLSSLTPREADVILHTWELWARPEQLEPPGDWSIWMPLAGRGWGKTRTGAEWVRHRVKAGDMRIACIAPTQGDIRRVMVEGESGLLNVCHANDKNYRGRSIGYPMWSPTNNTLVWDNGAKAEFFSAEQPERLRGPNFHSAWCDELAAWNNLDMVWNMVRYTLRLGKNPKTLITTTPKPKELIRTILKFAEKDPDKYIISRGSSLENQENIDLSAILEADGTRLGRQEIYAEILLEAAGALWNHELLDTCRLETWQLPGGSKDPKVLRENLERIVVSIDPAVTANTISDDTGIIVAGIDVNGIGYILEDVTGTYKPAEWASLAGELFYKWSADRVVAERNQGGDMVRYTLETENPNLPLRLVAASKGKKARAEPVSALYEQGKVKHVRGLEELENQMVSWEPLDSTGSPDRIDACVWALTELMLGGISRPPIRLSAPSKDILLQLG